MTLFEDRWSASNERTAPRPNGLIAWRGEVSLVARATAQRRAGSSHSEAASPAPARFFHADSPRSMLVGLLSATFSQTLRALAAERQRRPIVAIAISLALLAGWAAWFFGTKVLVVETSEAARLEVFLAAHSIDAPVAGRIASSRLAIGLEVALGDVLVELESEPEKRRLREETTRLTTIAPQIEALGRA